MWFSRYFHGDSDAGSEHGLGVIRIGNDNFSQYVVTGMHRALICVFVAFNQFSPPSASS